MLLSAIRDVETMVERIGLLDKLLTQATDIDIAMHKEQLLAGTG